ncbi:site-specific integrase [Synechococcus sp. AH-601-B19]|nr:site-specific integrase [Synechococcus sp. AH-601-B19]
METLHFKQLTKTLKSEGKSAGTINRITTTLNTLTTELRQCGFAAPNVEYKHQKEPKGRPGFYSEAQMMTLFTNALLWKDKLLLHDSVLFLLKTGCRRGELMKLRHSDVDVENRTITFRDVKTDGDHIIHMHEDLIPVFTRRMQASSNGHVFDWDYGDQFLNEFKRLQTESNIPHDLVLHSIRHTTATWMIEKEVPLRAIMGVLNHSDVRTTLKYAKYTDKAVAAAIDVL